MHLFLPSPKCKEWSIIIALPPAGTRYLISFSISQGASFFKLSVCSAEWNSSVFNGILIQFLFRVWIVMSCSTMIFCCPSSAAERSAGAFLLSGFSLTRWYKSEFDKVAPKQKFKRPPFLVDYPLSHHSTALPKCRLQKNSLFFLFQSWCCWSSKVQGLSDCSHAVAFLLPLPVCREGQGWMSDEEIVPVLLPFCCCAQSLYSLSHSSSSWCQLSLPAGYTQNVRITDK